jgi:hypothetical protein
MDVLAACFETRYPNVVLPQHWDARGRKKWGFCVIWLQAVVHEASSNLASLLAVQPENAMHSLFRLHPSFQFKEVVLIVGK